MIPLAQAQAPQLSVVLERAAEYVKDFQRQLSSIVSEETSLQEVSGFRYDYRQPRRRQLRSDLLLVRPVDSDRWVQFRDVFEVDGKPVRDRAGRLTALFLNPDASRRDQFKRIVAESTRYNIGDVYRTFNAPLVPLQVLEQGHQPRFRFEVAAIAGLQSRPADDLPASANFTVNTEVWIVGFKETRGPTLIRTPAGVDVKSRGRFWIEPATGRVLMSEMIAESERARGQINVSYQSEPLLGLLVPVEMREVYGGSKTTIVATATYGRFRQFEVHVNEEIAPIR